MPTFNDRLKTQRKKLSDKEKQLEKLVKGIETARENVKAVNKEIADIKEEIQVLETRILTDTIANKGISIEEIAAAIEAGWFDKAETEKPPDTTDTLVENNCATYSTNNSETKSDKEVLDDEISSSGEARGGS